MSHSYRKPYVWMHGSSRFQKPWMSSKHRAHRRIIRRQLKDSRDTQEEIIPLFDEVANPWDSPRDDNHATYYPENKKLKRK